MDIYVSPKKQIGPSWAMTNASFWAIANFTLLLLK